MVWVISISFNAFSYLGCTPNVSSSIKDIASADASFCLGLVHSCAMEHLTQNDMGVQSRTQFKYIKSRY